jgi:hypothetical protein
MEVLLTRTEVLDRVEEVVRCHIEPDAAIRSSTAERVVRFFTARRDEELAALLGALVSAGLGVTHFGEVQTDLEEAFLNVARSSAEESGVRGQESGVRGQESGVRKDKNTAVV